MAYLLLLLIPAGPVIALGLAGYGLGTLGRAGVRRTDPVVWVRCVAALLAAVAAERRDREPAAAV